jgi:hypothetical protein
VKAATDVRDAGGTFDWMVVNSVKSLLFNAVMSCSTESSRATSRAIVVVANVKPGTVLVLCDNSHAPRSSSSRFNPTFIFSKQSVRSDLKGRPASIQNLGTSIHSHFALNSSQRLSSPSGFEMADWKILDKQNNNPE